MTPPQAASKTGGSKWLFPATSSEIPSAHQAVSTANCDNRRGPSAMGPQKEVTMLWTIFVILMIMWLLGMVTSYTLGGFIHILLLLAIVTVLIRVIQGRTPV